MAEKLCELRKKGGGGGKYTETSLWTNPSPTSAFAAQTVTLSDSIRKYKYIAIKYCINNSTTSQTNNAIYLVSDFITASKDTSVNHHVVGLTIQGADNAYYSRNAHYVNDTSVAFTLSLKENSSGTNTQGSIPLEILGLNELAQGKTNQTILWTNPSPTSSFAAQTISLDLSGYDAIILKCSSMTTNTLPATYPTNICSQQYLSVPYGVAGSGGSTYRISYGIGVESSNSFNSNRETIVTTTGVTFSGGYRNYSAGNQYAIPIQIIGVKIS